MKGDVARSRGLALAVRAFALALLPMSAYAAEELITKVADPTEQGDGTMSAAAHAAMRRGALPMNAAEVAAKAAATRASDRILAGPSAAAAGGAGPLATFSGGHNFAGQFDLTFAPADATGAIGTMRYIQMVNTRFGIYNRENNTLISQGELNQLAGLAPSVETFNPQIIWDAQQSRFFYAIASIFASNDNRLSWGFSKTASPNNPADFCKYTTGLGTRFPDFPKLGSSFDFLIVGVNSYEGNPPGFVGADIMTMSRPFGTGNITTCPDRSDLRSNRFKNLKDTGGLLTFSPVPAHQIGGSIGRIVARNGKLPSSKLWFYSTSRDPLTGAHNLSPAREANVASYSLPPDAPAGVGTNRKLDTLDARPSQAMQSSNPARDTFSFWVQHTVAVGSLSGVRWYEIDPSPTVPVVLRYGTISRAGTFLFNAAISSDRMVRKDVASAFGNSFVINYSATKSTFPGFNPRIEAVSSFNGGAVGGFIVVKTSPGPYVDHTCAGRSATCRWGDHAGANPDPSPPADSRGVVWGTNSWSSGGTATTRGNWRTQIFALRP